MKKNVLVLGGAGFIGLGITKYLGIHRDHEITIADITKNIIETTLKISTEYLEELHRLS